MENPNGVVAGNSQNVATANVPRTRSTFDLKYHMFDTHRFGEYHPHYVEEGVKEDVLPIRSSHNVMSYTLKSPLLQNITLYKDYFSVPMEAILPNNWEKFFDNPVRGDDVSVDVGCCVENFWTKVGQFIQPMYNWIYAAASDNTVNNEDYLVAVLRFLTLGEYFYSNGSLLASLGCHGATYVDISQTDSNSVVHRVSYDAFFDAIINAIVKSYEDNGKQFINITQDGVPYNVIVTGQRSSVTDITFRHFLSMIRDNPMYLMVNSASYMPSTLKSEVSAVFNTYVLQTNNSNVPLNLSRLFAYQLCCAHYYSNDHIDFVYSAELFRQLVGNYLTRFISASSWVSTAHFVRNGVRYQYDYLSAHFFVKAAEYLTSNASTILTANPTSVPATNVLGYFSAVFAYRRSLRYQDYFTGSRAQPLAVGSTGVTVTGNTVDVVDVTRNIQRQRFLNAVNRVRHNFEGYLQGIFGGDVPAPDYHNPFFLASTQDTIYGQETENTAANQMTDKIAITTNLRSNGSRYMLEIHCDRPCVILGISHYDLPRVYSRSIERNFFEKDRFDMFNPFMQYIGDQPIYKQELGIDFVYAASLGNFSYTLRHMEYKQRYNQAAGGFVEYLPGFAFLALDNRGGQSTINPDWIRSVPSEIDQFYVSLTGWSNASYFHFIIDNFNDCTGNRPMAYAPSIL